jgi:hypothetical protein
MTWWRMRPQLSTDQRVGSIAGIGYLGVDLSRDADLAVPDDLRSMAAVSVTPRATTGRRKMRRSPHGAISVPDDAGFSTINLGRETWARLPVPRGLLYPARSSMVRIHVLGVDPSGDDPGRLAAGFKLGEWKSRF